ncbi:MAG: HPr kinase/phosphatase C-terminal domain-containing protein, partial [Rhodovibrionaceae bacterium]|nr:HPr kinase/phosphatase C-terminal domain-containing protein [Rhodovibrionaceae bacterium]
MSRAGASARRRASTLIHGTLVFWRGAGLLLRGASGAGKSDLALRLIEAGGRLVADDQVAAALDDGRPRGRAPEALEGLMEVRGIGIVPVSRRAEAPIDIVVELVPAERIERIPESLTTVILGADIPLVH